MGPSNSSYLSKIAIFHFHDYGRKGNFPRKKTSSQGPNTWNIQTGKKNAGKVWFLLILRHTPPGKVAGMVPTLFREPKLKRKFHRLPVPLFFRGDLVVFGGVMWSLQHPTVQMLPFSPCLAHIGKGKCDWATKDFCRSHCVFLVC